MLESKYNTHIHVTLATLGVLLLSFGLFQLGNVYAQEQEESYTDTAVNVAVSIAGFLLLLIPIVRRELIARRVTNPTIHDLLNNTERIASGLVESQEEVKQVSQIVYNGLPMDYMERIEGKYPKAKLQELEAQIEKKKQDAQNVLDLIDRIRNKTVA